MVTNQSPYEGSVPAPETTPRKGTALGLKGKPCTFILLTSSTPVLHYWMSARALLAHTVATGALAIQTRRTELCDRFSVTLFQTNLAD
jgi:hypothetical protein